MTPPTSPAMAAMTEALADGQWHDGWRVFRAMERAIPPGVASRNRRLERADPDSVPVEELIRSGRRDIAQGVLMNAIRRGKVEVEGGQATLTRGHWVKELPFRIREPLAGSLSVEEAADQVGMTRSVVRTWLRNGYVPHTTSPAGQIRFTRDQVEIVRAVMALYPGPGKRWTTDPRTLWDPNRGAPEGFKCPHCNQSITVILGKG